MDHAPLLLRAAVVAVIAAAAALIFGGIERPSFYTMDGLEELPPFGQTRPIKVLSVPQAKTQLRGFVERDEPFIVRVGQHWREEMDEIRRQFSAFMNEERDVRVDMLNYDAMRLQGEEKGAAVMTGYRSRARDLPRTFNSSFAVSVEQQPISLSLSLSFSLPMFLSVSHHLPTSTVVPQSRRRLVSWRGMG